MRVHPYFRRSRKRHPHVTEEMAKRVANRYEHEEVQEDGRIRRWGYVKEIDKYIRVILLPDGETLFNAFPDRDYEKKYKP